MANQSKIKLHIRHINGGTVVPLLSTIGVAATLLLKNVSVWLTVGAIALGLAMTFLVMINHTTATVETRMREFSREFNDLKEQRRKAARFVLTCEGRQDDVDDVLDFFEDLGTAVARYEISPERAHYYFYTWIQAYWEQWFDYILEKQKEENIWKQIFPLYDATKRVENGGELTKEKLAAFWDGEASI